MTVHKCSCFLFVIYLAVVVSKPVFLISDNKITPAGTTSFKHQHATHTSADDCDADLRNVPATHFGPSPSLTPNFPARLVPAPHPLPPASAHHSTVTFPLPHLRVQEHALTPTHLLHHHAPTLEPIPALSPAVTPRSPILSRVPALVAPVVSPALVPVHSPPAPVSNHLPVPLAPFSLRVHSPTGPAFALLTHPAPTLSIQVHPTRFFQPVNLEDCSPDIAHEPTPGPVAVEQETEAPTVPVFGPPPSPAPAELPFSELPISPPVPEAVPCDSAPGGNPVVIEEFVPQLTFVPASPSEETSHFHLPKPAPAPAPIAAPEPIPENEIVPVANPVVVSEFIPTQSIPADDCKVDEESAVIVQKNLFHPSVISKPAYIHFK